MEISAISDMLGLSGYRISSIQGNPYSMNPISKIGQDSESSGRPLVIAQPESKENLYVKDYGDLEQTTSTATGDFAEMLEIASQMSEPSGEVQTQNTAASYFNDMIGTMGYCNGLRDQLLGTGFVPFE